MFCPVLNVQTLLLNASTFCAHSLCALYIITFKILTNKTHQKPKFGNQRSCDIQLGRNAMRQGESDTFGFNEGIIHISTTSMACERLK